VTAVSPFGRVALMAVLAGTASAAPLAARQFSDVASAVQSGIREGVFPGAVVVIGRRDTVLYSRGFGRLTWSADAPAASPDSTLWDLASLTKVVATASIALALHDRGQLDLDATVAGFLPRFTGGGREQVTLRMLLDHTSGLPAFAPLYRNARTRDDAIEQLWGVALRRRPGELTEYSDLNAILLGLVLERVGRLPLDQLARQEVFEPLGMRQTFFAPPASLRARIAPSMRDRQGPIAGRPSDPNALAMGGIAGHAGVFGTAADLARFAQAWLRQGLLSDGSRWVSAEAMAGFMARAAGSGGRMLGWDVPNPGPLDRTTAFGALASAATFGHTGWTGTSLWLDPAGDLFVVLLTNRSYDPRVRQSLVAIRDVRHRVSDAARTSVLAQCRVVVQVSC